MKKKAMGAGIVLAIIVSMVSGFPASGRSAGRRSGMDAGRVSEEISGRVSGRGAAPAGAAAGEAEVRMPKSLTWDPSVNSGSLENGIRYYIVENASETGLAEFALVQRIGSMRRRDLDSTVAHTRALITDMPRFGGRSLRGYLAGSGAYAVHPAQGSAGCDISERGDAVVYRFGALPVGAKGTVMDSTLMMIFNLIETMQKTAPLPAGYSTADNAVIISGDVDKASVLSKLKLFSLTVEKAGADEEAEKYEWQPRDSIICYVDTTDSRRAAFLTVSYSSPRIPDKYMGTSLPEVSAYFGDILGIVLKKRIYTEMRIDDIPLAWADCNYIKSSDSPWDERYEITVCVPPERVAEASRIVTAIVYDIDHNGVRRQEFGDARNEYLTKLYISSLSTVVSNRSNVDKCVTAFLYGAVPVTDMQRWEFLAKGKTDDSRTAHFNNFASKFLSATRNLTVRLTTGPAARPGEDDIAEGVDGEGSAAEGMEGNAAGGPAGTLVSEEELKGIFSHMGDSSYVGRPSYFLNQRDTLSLGVPAAKVKVTSTSTEGVSGGVKWVFSNGMTVVYKRMETQGLFYYNLLVRGGFSAVEGLNRGEGAFLGDMLALYDVAGMRGENFYNLLRVNGITVGREVTVSDMSLYGVALRPSLGLLLKALTTFTNSGEVDTRAFDYYRRSELLRLEADKGSDSARAAVIDSLFSPSYRYYSGKSASGLHDGLAELAGEFFDSQFAKLNDGVLVIVGDMNEDILKKLLLKYIGGFRTGDVHPVRSRVSYSPSGGQITHTVQGPEPGIDVEMSAPMSFSADNYMTMKVAEMALQDVLNRRLVGTGTKATVTSDFFSYPQERAILKATIKRVNQRGLPLDEEYADEVDLLFRIRDVLDGFSVTASDLSLYKSVLKNEFKARQSDPWYWIYMVKTRFSAVKDLNSKYETKIDGVSAEKVAEMVSTLNGGSKVEYVVR